MKNKITASERVLVSSAKDGKTWFVWHKCRGRGRKNPPIRCSYERLAKTIRDLLVEAGKIDA